MKTANEFLREYSIQTINMNDDFNSALFIAMEGYAEAYGENIVEELLQRPDMLIDAVQNENTNWDAKSLVEMCNAQPVEPKTSHLAGALKI